MSRSGSSAPGGGATAPQQRPGFFKQATDAYGQLVMAIIRPPRVNYNIWHLGFKNFEFGGKEFERTDFQVVNGSGQRLACSHWQPIAEDRPAPMLP